MKVQKGSLKRYKRILVCSCPICEQWAQKGPQKAETVQPFTVLLVLGNIQGFSPIYLRMLSPRWDAGPSPPVLGTLLCPPPRENTLSGQPTKITDKEGIPLSSLKHFDGLFVRLFCRGFF